MQFFLFSCSSCFLPSHLPQATQHACSSLRTWCRRWGRTSGSASSASPAVSVALRRMTYVSYIAPVFPAPIYTLCSTQLISIFIYILSCVLYLPLSRLRYWLCVFLAGPASVLRWLWQRISHVLPEASNDPASWRWAPPFQVLFNTDAKKAMHGGIKGHIPVTLVSRVLFQGAGAATCVWTC